MAYHHLTTLPSLPPFFDTNGVTQTHHSLMCEKQTEMGPGGNLYQVSPATPLPPSLMAVLWVFGGFHQNMPSTIMIPIDDKSARTTKKIESGDIAQLWQHNRGNYTPTILSEVFLRGGGGGFHPPPRFFSRLLGGVKIKFFFGK